MNIPCIGCEYSTPVHPKAVKWLGATCQSYNAQVSMQAPREETLLMVCRSVISELDK